MFIAVFGIQNALKFVFRARFQVIFLSISDSTFRRLGLPNRGFCMEGIAKMTFHRKVVMDIGGDFFRFLKALGAAFLVF